MVPRKKRQSEKQLQIQMLLDLAVNCKLITAEKEKRVLPELQSYIKKHPKTPLAACLVKNKVLDSENTRFLFAVHKHLELLMADKKFGKLGIANRFVEADKVKKALKLQIEIFKKRQKSIKIGDILVQNKDITVADKTAILLTQDRIKDEYLADAFNTIAGSKIEQMAMNKRFGAIAVKKEYINTDQLNQALNAQKKETEDSKNNRYLGEFLRELFDLSEKDILSILKIQKKLETRRMNLEKQMDVFNHHKDSISQLDEIYEYHVSNDKLRAYVHQVRKSSVKIILDNFMHWFAFSGINTGLCSNDKIQAFLAEDTVDNQIEIARGDTPKPFVEESVTYHFDTALFEDKKALSANGNGSESDAHEKIVGNPSELPRVKKDDVLATIVPHQEALPGTDVFGRPVYLPEEPVISLAAGEGVVKQNNQFIALLSGHPKLFRNRTLFVTPAFDSMDTREIDEDITEDAPEEYRQLNLRIKGNIVPGVHLSCHHLAVEGDIMGDVTATGNIDISGGIGSELNGPEAELAGCTVEAKGRIKVNQKIINARIIAKNGLNAPNSDLVASQVISCGNIVLSNVFSSKKAPSLLRVTRENAVELNKILKGIDSLEKGLRKITRQEELDLLSNKLMEQIQIQNGYLEKQNVMLFLNRAIKASDLSNATIDQIIADYQEKSNQTDEHPIKIPENTKAHRFLLAVVKKVQELDEKDQRQSVRELLNSISGMYKASVKATSKIHKQYEARSESIRDLNKNGEQNISKIKDKIETLNTQKDYLLLELGKKKARVPVIEIKNKAGRDTIVMGEEAKLMIDKNIFRVSFKEEKDSQKKIKVMSVKGLYD